VLIAKPGTDGVLLEVWGGGRLLKELQVWTPHHLPATPPGIGIPQVFQNMPWFMEMCVGHSDMGRRPAVPASQSAMLLAWSFYPLFPCLHVHCLHCCAIPTAIPAPEPHRTACPLPIHHTQPHASTRRCPRRSTAPS
jgi:hypothetical protein